MPPQALVKNTILISVRSPTSACILSIVNTQQSPNFTKIQTPVRFWVKRFYLKRPRYPKKSHLGHLSKRVKMKVQKFRWEMSSISKSITKLKYYSYQKSKELDLVTNLKVKIIIPQIIIHPLHHTIKMICKVNLR